MSRDELLVFRILRVLKTRHAQYLDEAHIRKALRRETGVEYPADVLAFHLSNMLRNGLLKLVTLSHNLKAYKLDWAGHDYLDAS
ncbi:hypothetical protein [uncultured Aquitalea sp.]|uniref:hypothetical protein n=1 Tax=uncultured Aquitalea sp. TaxID=540272 RepID=UPI0025D24155|nr:hypothetical protein [uncultured Aquitalea sp.]